jgi:hypothetical protein
MDEAPIMNEHSMSQCLLPEQPGAFTSWDALSANSHSSHAIVKELQSQGMCVLFVI